jgi:class 3 adenylate cyclase
MKLKKFEDYIIKEAVDNSENPKRSERVLSQAQKQHEESPETNGENSPSLMPAMVFTDVVGSSKLWSDDPQTMAIQLEAHHKLIDGISDKYHGWIVKTIGDAFMVYFEPSKDSLLNALKFSKEVILMEKKYNLRVGVCLGNMEQKTYRIQNVDLKDFFGNAVNTASRMESKVSEAGGIAFTSIKPISTNVIGNIENVIGEVDSISGEGLDLRGVTIDTAYRIKVK